MNIYFKLNGFEYRTNDGERVEGHDGKSWNATYSIPVILAARDAYKAAQLTNRRYEDGAWIKQRQCLECWRTVDAGDPCCDGE